VDADAPLPLHHDRHLFDSRRHQHLLVQEDVQGSCRRHKKQLEVLQGKEQCHDGLSHEFRGHDKLHKEYVV